MRYAWVATVAVAALAVSACGARSQVYTGVGVDHGGLSHIQMAVGDVYGMPVGPMPSYIYPDELPVVYLLAREAGVSPEVVMALRERGWSWMDITYHLGVDPYLYVAHLPRQRGYWGYPGHSYAYLTDRHIIDYVNLALWASYHRRPVTQIIVIRQRVPTWTYYVHYHAPRVVYVNNQPRRYDPPPARRGDASRPQEPRRAEPRRAEARTTPPAREAARTDAPQTTRLVDRSARPAIPGTDQPRTAVPTRPLGDLPRPDARPENRPTAPPVRPAQPTTRPGPDQRPMQPPVAPVRPVGQPTRPGGQDVRPTGVVTPPTARTVTPPSRPAATPPSRSVTPGTRPTTTPPAQPATPPSRPAAQAPRPAGQTPPPAAQSSRPAAQSRQPAAQQSRPAAQTRREAASSRGERRGD
jgi:hypothetical protein